MKKYIFIIIAVLMMSAVFVGCTGEITEETEVPEAAPAAVEVGEETLEAPEPPENEPVYEPVRDGIRYTDPPEGAEVPEGYEKVTEEFNAVIAALPYTVYYCEDADGVIHYIAYGEVVADTGETTYSAWYVMTYIDGIVFSDVLGEKKDVPAGYEPVDEADSAIPQMLGYTVYMKETDGEKSYIVYGTKYDAETSEITEQKWYDVVIGEKEITEETAVSFLKGEVAENADVIKYIAFVQAEAEEQAEAAEPSEADDSNSGVTSSNESKPSGGTSDSKPAVSGGSSAPSTNNSTPAPSEPSGHWETVTKTVEKDVYEMRDITKCNTCGADISGNVPAHGDSHLLNGEPFSYHVGEYEVKIGTETVTIEEQVWVED